MGTLREEVLRTQQTRSDLLKWKLGLVGVIGAVGLGLAGSRLSAHADLVLCAIPLVCVYVDLLCRHLSLRILVIGTYLRGAGTLEDPEAMMLERYEQHVQAARRLDPGGAFDLEDWAVSWSTAALSLAVLVYGVTVIATGDLPAGITFILSALAGTATTVFAQRNYLTRFRALSDMAQEPGATHRSASGPRSPQV